MAMSKGVCPNSACPSGASGTLVDRYEGPGEYCPDCGELLRDAPQSAPPPSAGAATVPFGGLSALQALQQFEPAEPPPAAPQPGRPSFKFRRLAIAGVIVALVAGGTTVAFHMPAVGQAANPNTIQVCRSSMTKRLAADIVHAYTQSAGTSGVQFDLTAQSGCDVRFSAASDGVSTDIVGRDGVVVVVNPANSVTHLSFTNLAKIFKGEITNWSQVGGKPGPIVAMMPQAGSDETQILNTILLHVPTLGDNVTRLPTSADVTRAVVSASGRNAIGLVSFSEAVPGKVITLRPVPPASPLTIGNQRYPFSLAVSVNAEGSTHAAAANALVQFAHSEDAQAIVMRDGLVPKKGI